MPFDFAVKQVSEQLKKVASGDYTVPSTEKRKLGTIVFAAVSLPVTHIQNLLNDVSGTKHLPSVSQSCFSFATDDFVVIFMVNPCSWLRSTLK